MELTQDRIPMNTKENEAIEKLLENHAGNASLTRRDPGNTGPVIVEFGDQTWEINESGKTKKVSN